MGGAPAAPPPLASPAPQTGRGVRGADRDAPAGGGRASPLPATVTVDATAGAAAAATTRRHYLGWQATARVAWPAVATYRAATTTTSCACRKRPQ